LARVFLSYAREDAGCAHKVAEALNGAGHAVWWDHQIHGGSRYAEEIDRELSQSDAVVVLWSPSSIASAWVLDEAAEGRDTGRLIPVLLGECRPPLGYRQFQSIDLQQAESLDVRQLLRAIEKVTGEHESRIVPRSQKAAGRQKAFVCVLPFVNMSGDVEQEYFSDGITEDIATDLSKVSALGVTARNAAFMFKGRVTDVREIARALGVTHVLEGSVRKAGERLRITAQLVEGSTGEHVWAERYDRNMTDIFAIQDDISHAIVDALKLKLLPQESEAIASRGTESVHAYNLYLKARQQWISGTYGTVRRDEAIVQTCRKAVAVDPKYAQAWALMALAQAELRFWHGEPQNPLEAANRALALNPALPEALCVKARHLEQEGRVEEANRLIQTAIELDPDSWEVNREAARLLFREKRLSEAVPHFEKAMALMSNDFHSGDILMDCYTHLGDRDSLRRVAEQTLPRCEAAIADDPANGTALATGVAALLALGDDKRAREWITRALLLDPDNSTMLYNLACPLTRHGTDPELALQLFERSFANLPSADLLKHVEADPDLISIRKDPRFMELLTGAKARIGVKH
jgi:adenylate cyclase